MRIGVIGLGDIAAKAYLPVLGPRSDLSLALMSRDPAKVAKVGDAWRIPARFTELDALIAHGLDGAFVHAATEAHPVLVERLIEAGVATYVDKPLADRLEDCERLTEMAERGGVSLMVGFNRRFAPDYSALATRPRDLVLMQKHRAGPLDPPRRTVFDDFIHVVDTLRFLAPGLVIRTAIETKVEHGLLRQVSLTLSGDGFAAIGLMNRQAGANLEAVEIVGGGRRTRVEDMADVIEEADGVRTLRRRGDWTPVAQQRGVAQACEHFLTAVREGRPLSALDALETHRLCEEIVRAVEG